jgi:hypothetical protein
MLDQALAGALDRAALSRSERRALDFHPPAELALGLGPREPLAAPRLAGEADPALDLTVANPPLPVPDRRSPPV